MESSVGYSQGSGTNIATHKFGDGITATHHQRFAVGTGKASMMQLIAPIATVSTSGAISCLGAGRIVLNALCTTDGAGIRLHFFDEKGMDIGCSDLIEPIVTARAAYNDVDIGWTTVTTYGPLKLLKISSNSHLYIQIAGDPDYVAGTSDAVEPTWVTDGSSVVDGTCEWQDLGVYTSLLTTPLIVFSNSMGASSFKVEIEVAAGTSTIFGDAV